MLVETKGTVFPQQKVTRNFSKDFSAIRKMLNNNDVTLFFMFADATCTTQPTVNIERIHTNVFKNKKIATPKIDKESLETLEILSDSELLKEIKMSQKAVEKNEAVPWEKVRIQV